MKQVAYFGGAVCFFFVLFTPVFAVTSVTIGNVPDSTDKDGEFEIDVSLICDGCTSDSYLRGVFYQSGTNYFGFTRNAAGIWTNASGTNCTEFYRIPVGEFIEGSWSGKLKVKPDSVSSYYAGPGQYNFKVGRYTESCNSPIWSSQGTLAITGPTSTPTPSAAFSPTPTHTMTPTPTSVPTKTPTPSKTKAPTPMHSAAVEPLQSPEEARTTVLGAADTPPRAATGSAILFRPLAIAAALVALGLSLLAGALIWQKRNTAA